MGRVEQKSPDQYLLWYLSDKKVKGWNILNTLYKWQVVHMLAGLDEQKQVEEEGRTEAFKWSWSPG